MRAIPRDVRSGARWTGTRVDHEDGTTINSLNAYHAAFSAVGRLLAAPFRFLRLGQQKSDLMPNRRSTRTVTMTKTMIQLMRAVRDGVVTPVVTWYKRQRMMEELNGLSDRVLADIGLTRGGIPAAVMQAYRPTWDAPLVATETLSIRTEARPAASNDTAKQPLAA